MKVYRELLRGGRPDLSALTEALDLPWMHDFASTPQDAQWHAEGDVAIHTQMVMDALYAEMPEVSPEERAVLILAAALHDYAKPVCTRSELVQGALRVTSRGHEARGRSALAHLLLGELPFGALWRLIGLVGSHHEPKLLVVRDKGLGDWRRVSRRADLDALATLELADMRGREAADRDAQIGHIAWFAELAAEHRGWRRRWVDEALALAAGRPPDVVDLLVGDTLRGLLDGRITDPLGFGHLAHALPDAVPELVLLVGPSGSGKTTFVARHLADAHLVSMDELRETVAGNRGDQAHNGRVRQEALELLRVGLRARRRVVWDATSLRDDQRAPLLQLARDYGALTTIVTLLVPEPTLRRQNAARRWAVPDGVLTRQLDTFQLPEVDEAHRLLVVSARGEVLGQSGCYGALPWGLVAADGGVVELDAG
jgi:predicted kinase